MMKHKSQLCAHGGMQQWGDRYWEIYSPVVNMLSARLIISISKTKNLYSKSIDFLIAFTQEYLEEDIWIQLPIRFQVESQTEEYFERNYILKSNKNLYGSKKGSYNWYKKLKKSLIDRGLKPSYIDPIYTQETAWQF